MSARAEVLLWAQRVTGRKGATAHQILEIPTGANSDDARDAFHKIARMAHPDLHRRTLDPDELELVTTAYARAAAAYHEIRGIRMSTGRIRTIRDGDLAASPAAAAGPGEPAPNKPAAAPRSPPSKSAAPPNKLAAATEEPASIGPKISARALFHYRRAELALSRGDLAGAVLLLRMAVASDPQSVFLRSALSEVEAEVTKKP